MSIQEFLTVVHEHKSCLCYVYAFYNNKLLPNNSSFSIVRVHLCWQMERQKALEAQKEKQLEERAKYIEKTKNLLVFKDTPQDDKPMKKGKVSQCEFSLA